MMEAVVGFVVWLGLGGWAFRTLSEDTDKNNTTAGLFLFCIILAPFAAGVAVADMKLKKPKKKTTP